MSNRTNKKASVKVAKEGTAYISFNRDEWTALQKLGFRERWAYAQLKWLANFKTGMLGNFRKQRLSYQDIANLVTVPGVQGRGMGNIDDTQAADFLQRMAAVGLLVQHPHRANGGLLLELPLSPINRKPLAAPSQQPTATTTPAPLTVISPDQPSLQATYSPDDDIPPFDESPTVTRVCDALTPSLSVLALTKLKNNTVGQRPANADAALTSRATGAAAERENPSAPPAPAAPRLSPLEIQQTIQDDWTYTETGTQQSLALFRSWSDAGITRDDLHAAMTSLDEAPDSPDHIPANLTTRLWPKVVDGWFDQLAA